jgi:hypothetical protein
MLHPDLSAEEAFRLRMKRRTPQKGDRHADPHRKANAARRDRMTMPFCGVDGEGGGKRKDRNKSTCYCAPVNSSCFATTAT